MTAIRMPSHFFTRRILALATIAMLTACGESGGLGGSFQPGQIIGDGTKQIAGVQPVAGFLPNPSLLQPGGAGRADLVCRSSTANFASYNKIILEPVAIWAAPNFTLNTVPVEQRQAAANTFYSDLYRALSRRCQMVTSPSPGTMRMRFVLIDAKIPNAAVNTVATYMPYASTAYGLASLAFNNGVGYFADTATAEGYATDATNGGLSGKP